MDPKVLSIGQSILIKRSDGMVSNLAYPIHTLVVCVPGRVHAAAISGIDSDKCFVAVEWFENNETKGKEVSKNWSAHYLEYMLSGEWPCLVRDTS
jgi:hypothetical protein